MRYFSKVLLANGLALAVGPFCFLASAQAQDYIDVEAERAAEAGKPSSSSSAAQPAQSYPVTSYGIGSSPAAPVFQGESPTSPVGGNSGANPGQLLIQVQQLQQEVMRLNGLVEEQAHELRTLKAQSLERYIDLDRRLGLLAGGTGEPAAEAATGPSASSALSVEKAPQRSSPVAPAAAAAQPGESEAYQAAYALVRSQQFNRAVTAFQQFLQDYPSGRFTPNAHYWLGELYLVTSPPDTEAARQSFMLLLDMYPNDSKVPDALFKLGRIHFTKGNRERAREFLDRVINEFGSSNSAAVKLAQDFISENY